MRGEPAPYSREHFLLREEAPAYEEDDDRERETLLGGGNGGGSAAMEQMQQIGGASSGYMERTCALLGPPLFLWVFFYAGCNVGPDLLSYFIICLIFLAASFAACFMERGEQARLLGPYVRARRPTASERSLAVRRVQREAARTGWAPYLRKRCDQEAQEVGEGEVAAIDPVDANSAREA